MGDVVHNLGSDPRLDCIVVGMTIANKSLPQLKRERDEFLRNYARKRHERECA